MTETPATGLAGTTRRATGQPPRIPTRWPETTGQRLPPAGWHLAPPGQACPLWFYPEPVRRHSCTVRGADLPPKDRLCSLGRSSWFRPSLIRASIPSRKFRRFCWFCGRTPASAPPPIHQPVDPIQTPETSASAGRDRPVRFNAIAPLQAQIHSESDGRNHAAGPRDWPQLVGCRLNPNSHLN